MLREDLTVHKMLMRHNFGRSRGYEVEDIKKMSMTLPDDYSERVYAGVLGKVIGVYLG